MCVNGSNKGEGVWIEGVTAEELQWLACASVPVESPYVVGERTKFWGIRKRVKVACADLLAQLTPSAEAGEGAEEECCPKCCVGNCKTDHAHHWCSLHSPAKVGIELTAENWSMIQCSLRNDGNDDLADKIDDYFFSEAQALTPPVEVEEPRDYTTFVRANEKGFFSRHKWQKNIANDLWCSDDGDQNVRWSDLENPQVIGEEK